MCFLESLHITPQCLLNESSSLLIETAVEKLIAGESGSLLKHDAKVLLFSLENNSCPECQTPLSRML